jgi:hypothetical protein
VSKGNNANVHREYVYKQARRNTRSLFLPVYIIMYCGSINTYERSVGRGIVMKRFGEIIGIYQDSFRANMFTTDPFRMIGLIDVAIRYYYGIERVTLAFYRSSGNNSGKVKGLWYPIVGIKIYTGEFTEFTKYINCVLTETTKGGYADEGWLAKSLFFGSNKYGEELRGFSYGVHRESLLEIGRNLRYLYENNQYYLIKEMDAEYINSVVTLNSKLYNNIHSQRENYERFIHDIYREG